MAALSVPVAAASAPSGRPWRTLGRTFWAEPSAPQGSRSLERRQPIVASRQAAPRSARRASETPGRSDPTVPRSRRSVVARSVTNPCGRPLNSRAWCRVLLMAPGCLRRDGRGPSRPGPGLGCGSDGSGGGTTTSGLLVRDWILSFPNLCRRSRGSAGPRRRRPRRAPVARRPPWRPRTGRRKRRAHPRTKTRSRGCTACR